MHKRSVSIWLKTNNIQHMALFAEIQKLRAHRSLAGAIRDGLRLILDLRAGRLDVLMELFPWIGYSIQTGGTPAFPQTPAAGGKPPVPFPVADDDDELLVTVDTNAGQQSSANFLGSLLALAS